MSFQSLGLRAELLRAVDAQGYTEATPIQQQAIPLVLKGADLMASARTGTGKTAAFTLPLLQQLATDEQANGQLRALILTPTRELAAQVHENLSAYSRHLRLRSTTVFGGVSINTQISKLRRGVDVLIATPGRLLDHMQRGTVDLRGVKTLVLDEADRMLDMGFRPAIDRIVTALPRQRQTLLFSATFSSEIRQLAQRYLNKPEEVSTSPANSAVEVITQRAYSVDKSRKRELLSWLIGDRDWHQVLVFSRTKHGADRLAKQLSQDGLPAEAIHGNKSQGARTRALANFKARKVRVLVATDIAARGLDIDQLPQVINFDLPAVAEDYVHRIGRTGRAGNPGNATSLVAPDEGKLLQAINRLTGKNIALEAVAGFEPSKQHGSGGDGNERRRPPSNARRSPKPGQAKGRRQPSRRGQSTEQNRSRQTAQRRRAA